MPATTHTSTDVEASWQRLHDTTHNKAIGFFLGAGLSIPNRFPSWPALTAAICRRDESDVECLVREGVGLETQLAVAREEAADETWIENVRSHLYEGFLSQLAERADATTETLQELQEKKRADPSIARFFEATNPALTEIVKTCSVQRERAFVPNPRVGAVLTTNVDALVQMCDRAFHGSPRVLRTIERASKSARRAKISLYHLHGYLTPYRDAGPSDEAPDRLVFTEKEYTTRNDRPNHWASTTLHWTLREYPVVFVGCSMTDTLVRRALYRSREERIIDARAEEGSKRRLSRKLRPRHFAVRKLLGNEAARETVVRSYELMDLDVLWVRDFDNDLRKRLEALRRALA